MIFLSKLLTCVIDRACRPTLSEPNLALNLEICDYVNAKQGSVPREAAIAVVKLINQRDPQTSELAIHLLDNLVKNCGYPFHLQISRKEFLNELVKRFPERPTLRYNRVQRLVLAQIEEWYQTICKTSKYKDDFGYIRDMHRLLLNKGYVFPEVKVEDAAVLNPADTLKSLEDIQKEDAIVHSAKLQELIRRGKPGDLQEANKLMKIMAGFKEENVQENRKQVTDDVARLKRKTEIFAEMLNSIQEGGASIDESNETIFELYGQIKSAQPSVTKIIEEEHDNEDYVRDLLVLNDTINRLAQNFQLMKGGNVAEASNIKVSGGVAAASAAKELNLIDFDDEIESSDVTGKDQQGYDDLLSELSNLAFTDTGAKPAAQVNPLDFFGSGGSIALGGSFATPASSTVPSNGNSFIQQPQPSSAGATSTNFDFLNNLNSPSPQLQSNTSTQLDPFGFDFPASSPAQVQASSVADVKSLNQNAETKLEVESFTAATASKFEGKFLVSNILSSSLTGLKFLVAVPKGCKLDLKPQSGDVLHAFVTRGFSQVFSIDNPAGKALKVKWKLEYIINGQAQTQTGISNLSE